MGWGVGCGGGGRWWAVAGGGGDVSGGGDVGVGVLTVIMAPVSLVAVASMGVVVAVMAAME